MGTGGAERQPAGVSDSNFSGFGGGEKARPYKSVRDQKILSSSMERKNLLYKGGGKEQRFEKIFGTRAPPSKCPLLGNDMLTMAFLLSRVLDRVDSPQFHEWAGSRHVCERDAVASQGGEAKRAREKVDMMVHPHQRGGN